MKLTLATSALLGVAISSLPPGATSVSGACLQGDFSISGVGPNCTFETLLFEFETFFADPVNSGGCTHSAEDELLLLLGANDVHSLCGDAFANYNLKVPFEQIPLINEYGREFIGKFYNGGTTWNEEYQTEYPTDEDGNPTNILRRDAENIDDFYDGQGQYGMVEWPGYLPNFASCSMDAVYCCWPQDRQANDNNGNCNEPYDENCIDKDPADNTDLCYVDISAGAISTGMGATGGLVFPRDDGNNKYDAEGPIHCHGFAWANDANDPSSVYKSNNLFYVSMYDHMHQRGYVRNIPGAPMCACAEQMPVVSRSDCTQVDVEQEFKFIYKDGSFTAILTNIYIDFNSCQGINRQGNGDNNDLYAYANRLFLEGKYSRTNLEGLGRKLVGDNRNTCRDAERQFMATKQLVVGYNYDDTAWTQVAGTDALAGDYEFGPFSFAVVFEASPNKIIKRKCATCVETHQTIYYKRTTPVPDGLDILQLLKSSTSEVAGQIWDTDFTMHSTYDDALSGINAWICPDSGYAYSKGFPGNCGPYGEVKNQGSRSRYDIAFYVEGQSPFEFVESSTIGIGIGKGSSMRMGETYFMYASTGDIWGTHDSFQFHYRPHSGDIELEVQVTNFTTYREWAKAGLMIRDSTDPGAPYVAVLVTGDSGVVFQWRDEPNGEIYSRGSSRNSGDITPIWLRLMMLDNTVVAYTSVDGVGWTELPYSKLVDFNPDTTVAGHALAKSSGSQPAEVVLSNTRNIQFTYPSASPSGSPAPTIVVAREGGDIGATNAALPGSTSYAANSGRYILKAAGIGTNGKRDSLHFYGQKYVGDFTVTAFVESIEAPDYWTSAGVMVRASKDPDSANIFVQLVPDRGMFATYRLATNSNTKNTGLLVNPRSSGWVRISRQGDSFTASRSIDGIAWDDFSMQTFGVGVMSDPVEVGLALNSGDNRYLARAVMEQFSIQGVLHTWPSAAPSRSLEPTATVVDSLYIGYTGSVAGSATYDPASDKYTVMASGSDIWNSRDSFYYAPFRVEGDFTATVFLESFTITDASEAWAKAGLMIRQNAHDDAPHVSIFLTPETRGIMVASRTEFAGTTTRNKLTNTPTTSTWLLINRWGNTITCMSAGADANGAPAEWTLQYETTNNPAFSDPVEIGMALSAHNNNKYGTAVFSNFKIEFEGTGKTHSFPSAAPSKSPAPTTTNVGSFDIGNVGSSHPGSATYAEKTNVYTITATGSDIWGTFDGFHFVPFHAQGDFVATVFIESFDCGNQYGKAGLMVRDNLGASSANVFAIFRGDGIILGNYRDTYEGRTSGGGTQTGPVENAWLRIERVGDSFTYSRSLDGGARWTDFFSIDIPMTDPVEVGMAVTSRDYDEYARAVFKGFQLDQAIPYEHPSAAPTKTLAPSTFNTNSLDIGSVNPYLPGSASHAEGPDVYTITASGNDIYRTKDEFHFAPLRTETGDFTATVFVESIDYPDVWAKAGVMVRQTLEANSTNVFAFLTGEYGPVMQAREVENQNTLSEGKLYDRWDFAWVRIQRVGDDFICSRSWDNEQWDEVHTFGGLDMVDPVYVGLALTSHQYHAYATAVFSNFQVVTP